MRSEGDEPSFRTKICPVFRAIYEYVHKYDVNMYTSQITGTMSVTEDAEAEVRIWFTSAYCI